MNASFDFDIRCFCGKMCQPSQYVNFPLSWSDDGKKSLEVFFPSFNLTLNREMVFCAFFANKTAETRHFVQLKPFDAEQKAEKSIMISIVIRI